MDRSKLIVIANVTSRNKIEELGIDQSNVIYKPVTLSKLKTVLNNTANIAPELVKESTARQETKFDAHVLVTEDNIINQKLIKRILEEHGITVDLASNGLESFEKRRSGNYDLLFMDIQMPVMDGIEATHEILDYEEDEELAHVPIVALTANALKGDRERFLSEGMDEYITKPIETTELLYILNKFLSDKASIGVKATAKEEVAETVEPVQPVAAVVDIIEEPNENLMIIEADKKILIAKKFLLARRILAKVVENLGHDHDLLSDMNTLEEKLASGDYDIVFADSDLITESISQANGNIAIISSDNANDPQGAAVQKGETVASTASKEEIENIITKYRG
jgi:CheY-like chemotaxis protein